MKGKFQLLQFFGLLLVCVACTPKKTALDQYFEGVKWEGINASGDEIKINNCRYQYKGELGEATTRLEMIDNKRLRMNHENGDTFFVSVLNLADKKILVLHDSLNCRQFFKSDQQNKFPTLDNHDKIDLSFLNLGVSIGRTIPIDLLKDVEEYSQEEVKNSGIKRSGQTINNEQIDVDLSAENRVLSITQSNIAHESIPQIIDDITAQLGFPPSLETVDVSRDLSSSEMKFVWKLIGIKIALYSNFYLDNERNRELNLGGEKQATLTVADDFLTQVEQFKANFLN